MHFLLIQLSFIISYQKVFASIYNSKCTTRCKFSGMICVNGLCKCDSKNRLFWTGARCLSCPNNWAMSETACIGFHGNTMSWMRAAAVCRDTKADLISLRDNNILPLVYQATSDSNRRRKRNNPLIDKTIVWTSASAVFLTNLGLYQWSDSSLNRFDSTHIWWCKRNMPHLGYYHPHDEPTRQIRYKENDTEKCVLFRRGKSSVQMLCLDDVLCGEEHPFICERSESTAQKYVGPAPMNVPDALGGGLKPGAGSNTNGNSNGEYNGNKNPNANLGMLVNSHASKSDKNSKSIIIIVVIAVLLLAAVIAGVFFFMKRRHETETQLNLGDKDIKGNQISRNKRSSAISDGNVSDITDADDSTSHHSSVGEHGLVLDSGTGPGKIDINMDGVKQQKNKRGGYSKQKFDEFE